MPQVAYPLILPIWLEKDQLPVSPDEQVLDWLFDQSSLTSRLTTLSRGAFKVLPLCEGWLTLRPDECAALSLREGSEGWVREVYLYGHQQPWVFARSVTAKSALAENVLNMSELGTRSLGELLFCDQAFERGTLRVCHYPHAWLPAVDQADLLWGRRSRFVRGALSVLVAEVFLPKLWATLSAQPEKN